MDIKKVLAGLLLFSVVMASCLKKNSPCGYTASKVVAPAAEIQTLKDSLYTNNITDFTVDPSGIFYHVDTVGTGTAINNLCSTLSLTYRGTYFGGTAAFDSTTGTSLATFQLGQVIVGLQDGLPFIKSGGQITIYIPPTLGYGATAVTNNAGAVVIPGNSDLIFTVRLYGVQ
jgi:FKBP-type peptidyl-prolyl cis-trans isomerase FkpA